MSLEYNYSSSYEENEYLISIFEGLQKYLEIHLDNIVSALRDKNLNLDLDKNYTELYLVEIHEELLNLIEKHKGNLQLLSAEKFKDIT